MWSFKFSFNHHFSKQKFQRFTGDISVKCDDVVYQVKKKKNKEQLFLVSELWGEKSILSVFQHFMAKKINQSENN